MRKPHNTYLSVISQSSSLLSSLSQNNKYKMSALNDRVQAILNKKPIGDYTTWAQELFRRYYRTLAERCVARTEPACAVTEAEQEAAVAEAEQAMFVAEKNDREVEKLRDEHREEMEARGKDSDDFNYYRIMADAAEGTPEKERDRKLLWAQIEMRDACDDAFQDFVSFYRGSREGHSIYEAKKEEHEEKFELEKQKILATYYSAVLVARAKAKAKA